jgi:hypothetical protein
MFSPTLSLLLMMAGAAPEDTRNRTTEQAVTILAGDIKKSLAGQTEVTLGAFSPNEKGHATQQSSYGVAFQKLFRQELEKLGIAIKPTTSFTVSGSFYEVEDVKTELQAIKLEISLFNRAKGTKQEFGQAITNQVSVAQILGLPIELPKDGVAKDRVQEVKKEVDKFVPPELRNPPEKEWGEKPKPIFVNKQIQPKVNSDFAIEILTAAPKANAKESHHLSDYQVQTPKDEGGLAFLDIPREHVYAVKLINRANHEVAVTLQIDGLSMYVACDEKDPKTGQPLRKENKDPLFHFVIVPKQSSVIIRGWFINLTESDEFKVTSYAESLAGELKVTSQVGTITACFHAAVPKDQPFPPGEPADANEYTQSANGTGQGARVISPFEKVERKIGALRATVSVRYSR